MNLVSPAGEANGEGFELAVLGEKVHDGEPEGFGAGAEAVNVAFFEGEGEVSELGDVGADAPEPPEADGGAVEGEAVVAIEDRGGFVEELRVAGEGLGEVSEVLAAGFVSRDLEGAEIVPGDYEMVAAEEVTEDLPADGGWTGGIVERFDLDVFGARRSDC